MPSWKDEASWFSAREHVLNQIHMWEKSPWIYYKGHMHIGIGKIKYITKLKARLARIEANGEISWREKLGQP